MSGSGGDTGSGDTGGAGKGSAGDNGSGYDNNGGYTPPTSAPINSGSGSGDLTSSFAPSADTGGGTSLDSFVNDPSQGNLTGPGPVTGSAGESSPFNFDNSSFLSGMDQYAGSPVSAGGASSVFDTGTSGVADLTPTSVPGQSAFETTAGSQAAAPGGASAAGTAAPAGVAGNPDATTSTDLSSINKKSAGNAGSGVSTGGSSGGILSSLGLGNGNGAGALVSGAGLLNSLINGNKPVAAVPQLNANAGAASATAAQQTSAGQALQQWQTTGTLPDSYESQVQQAANAAKQRAISNAAAQGLPTDPTQNTALAQSLQAIDAALPQQREAIAAQLAQSGQQMVNAGLQATGISSGVYQTLANLENSQNQQRGQAIANFAGALNGGGNKGLTLKVA